jgi:hypothetical protein
MAMLSFRVDDADAAVATMWANRLGMDRSQLLRHALRDHLVRLAAIEDALTGAPIRESETPLESISHWAPAEDWSDW